MYVNVNILFGERDTGYKWVNMDKKVDARIYGHHLTSWQCMPLI